MGGIGPFDPWLARGQADAAARSPRVYVVCDGHGLAWLRHRARLLAARTRGPKEPRDTGRTGPAGVHLHPHQPGWAVRRYGT